MIETGKGAKDKDHTMSQTLYAEISAVGVDNRNARDYCARRYSLGRTPVMRLKLVAK
jgi:hypothetical protein